VVGDGNGGVRRALLVQGKGRTFIIMRCHRNNDDAVNNVVAETMTNNTIIGSDGFVRRSKQQSKH
jgi:hypothetical protein